MKIFKSFYFAFNGIRTAFLSERNLKIHLGCATFIILVAFIFKISLIEWALIVLCIGLVLTAELFNTAFESYWILYIQIQIQKLDWLKIFRPGLF